MTMDQAMWYAAKPEFGILSEEVSIVAKKTFGGVPFNQAIDYLSDRFNSRAIRRAVALIKQGLASGGQLADILERTAEDAPDARTAQGDRGIASHVRHIHSVRGAIGTPFLFAISGKLMAIMETSSPPCLSQVPRLRQHRPMARSSRPPSPPSPSVGLLPLHHPGLLNDGGVLLADNRGDFQRQQEGRGGHTSRS